MPNYINDAHTYLEISHFSNIVFTTPCLIVKSHRRKIHLNFHICICIMISEVREKCDLLNTFAFGKVFYGKKILSGEDNIDFVDS